MEWEWISHCTGTIKPVIAVVKNPYQNQHDADNGSRKTKLQTVFLDLFPACFQNAAAAIPRTKLSREENTCRSYTKYMEVSEIPPARRYRTIKILQKTVNRIAAMEEISQFF